MSSVASPSRPRMRYTIGMGSPWNNTEQPWKLGHQLSTEQHKSAMETLASSLRKKNKKKDMESRVPIFHETPQNSHGKRAQPISLKETQTDADNLPHWQRHWLTWTKQTTYLTDKNTDWYRRSRQSTSLTETKIDANKADNLPHWQRHRLMQMKQTTYLTDRDTYLTDRDTDWCRQPTSLTET